MFNWLFNVIVRAVAVVIFGYFFPSLFIVQPDSHSSVIGFIILISIISGTIGILLKFISAPFNWLTFGLINFLINLFVIHLADNFVDGVEVKGFLGYIGIALVLSLVIKKTKNK